MKRWILFVAMSLASTGCTALSLERHTLAQGNSATELRYREVMDNLAMVAHEPSSLPAYSSIFAGTAQISDTASLGSSALVVTKGLMSATKSGLFAENLNPSLSRTVAENWSLDPIVAPEKIEAMRCACQWVLYGREKACASCPGLLDSPEHYPGPGRHFGVAERLAHLPAHWLNVGCLTDVPHGARYKSHCDGTWVWVMPEGMQGLADFNLVLQDIARIDINSDSLYYWPPTPCVYARRSEDKPPQANAPRPSTDTLDVSAYVQRSDKCCQLSVNPPQLVPATMYKQVRLENLGLDPSLRSQVSAAGGP